MSLFGMQSFMRHAPSQCLTAYVTSHNPCGMWSFMRHAPPQCLTPNVNLPYSMYVELYASCSSSSMSDTVCMSYHIPWEGRSFIYPSAHLNVYIVYACHVIFHVINGFMRHAASILSLPNRLHHFMRYAPSQYLTPYSSLIFDVECEAL